ncbi:MAG: hypothetical protein GC182_08540 [Rhodopseudomonas sp.]|nr:hypothetical protein [Rhodopseudomonas sp.]
MSVDGQFGGRITWEFDGQKISLGDASVKLHPALVEVTAKANWDGSAAYELKPSLAAVEFELRHQDGVDYNALMFKKGNLTVDEENNGRTHMWTGTRMTGKPVVDLGTGAVTGMMGQGGTYRRIDA